MTLSKFNDEVIQQNWYPVLADKEKLEDHYAARLSLQWKPKIVKAKDTGVILRHRDQDGLFGSSNVLEPRRFGLVPPTFASSSEADKYKKWFIRGERMFFERNQSLLTSQRCLIPLTKDGKVYTAAGIHARWSNPSGYILSYALLTLPTSTTDYHHRHVFFLNREDWGFWLNPNQDIKKLRDFIRNQFCIRTK